jgi:hypothetical protein
MYRSASHLLALVLATMASGCAPPELTAPQEELVSRCLELAHKQETSAECGAVTKPMEKAFLEKQPEFYDRLLADRKTFVEERITADQRLRDELDSCVDKYEAGKPGSRACASFTEREIKRASVDRRFRRCAEAQLDGKPDARKRCAGLSDREIEDEVQAERVRRESRKSSRS